MKVARNSFYSLLGTLLPAILSVVTVPFYIDRIGQERYGALALAWLALGYFGQADFGIGRAIIQRISSLRGAPAGQRAESVCAAVLSIIPIGACGALLLYAATTYYFSGPLKIAPDLRDELVQSVWILALCNPLVAVNGVLSGALMGVDRFKLVSFTTAFCNAAMLLFPLLTASFFSVNLKVLILASFSARLLGVLMLAWGVWRVFLRGQRLSISWPEIRNLANFGAWAMVTALISPFMIFADRFIIGSVFDAQAVAAYAIPFQVANRLQIFPNALTQALFPGFAASSEDQSRAHCADFTLYTAHVFAPLIIGLIVLATVLMQFWLGHKLDPRSVMIARIILAGIWINSVAGVPFAHIQARGNPRFTGMLHVFELPFYLLMLFGLGLAFGLDGIAMAFSLRCAVDCLILAAKAGATNRQTLQGIAGQSALILVAIIAGQAARGWGIALLETAVLCGLSCLLLLLQLPERIRAKLLASPLGRRLAAPLRIAR